MAPQIAFTTLRQETQDFCQILKIDHVVKKYETFTSTPIETDVFKIRGNTSLFSKPQPQWTLFPDNIELNLKLGIYFTTDSCVELYLRNSSLLGSPPMRLKYTIGFLDQTGQQLFPTRTKEFVNLAGSGYLYWSAPNTKLTTHSNKLMTFFTTENPNLLTNGAVTAFVSGTVEYNVLTFSEGNKVFAMKTEAKKEETEAKEEAETLPLLAETHLADVILKCEELEIPCHKIILAWKSKVLQAMFKEDNFIEAKDKMVEIKNTDAETLDAFVHFVYSGKAKNLTSKAKELFALADRYDIQPLKKICSEYLQQNMQVDDAAEILVLGYLHNEADLKSTALNFVIKNFQKVRNTEDWKMIMKRQHKILDEVFLALTEKV